MRKTGVVSLLGMMSSSCLFLLQFAVPKRRITPPLRKRNTLLYHSSIQRISEPGRDSPPPPTRISPFSESAVLPLHFRVSTLVWFIFSLYLTRPTQPCAHLHETAELGSANILSSMTLPLFSHIRARI